MLLAVSVSPFDSLRLPETSFRQCFRRLFNTSRFRSSAATGSTVGESVAVVVSGSGGVRCRQHTTQHNRSKKHAVAAQMRELLLAEACVAIARARSAVTCHISVITCLSHVTSPHIFLGTIDRGTGSYYPLTPTEFVWFVFYLPLRHLGDDHGLEFGH